LTAAKKLLVYRFSEIAIHFTFVPTPTKILLYLLVLLERFVIQKMECVKATIKCLIVTEAEIL